jgi:tetratricopeptide (TPR) repeat protein
VAIPTARVRAFRTLPAVLALAFCSPVHAQQKSPDPAPEPPRLPTLVPDMPPRWIVLPQPNPLPAPPDAPLPDLGRLRSTPDPSQSRLRQAIGRALPRCLDAVTHTCWSTPPTDDNNSAAQREFINDMDVGKMYFTEQNYRGAELRFRDALLRRPDNPEATFRLAESLDRQHKNEEARVFYQDFLHLQTDGAHADLARKRLHHLEQSPGDKK